jgi:hypothetical protein
MHTAPITAMIAEKYKPLKCQSTSTRLHGAISQKAAVCHLNIYWHKIILILEKHNKLPKLKSL